MSDFDAWAQRRQQISEWGKRLLPLSETQYFFAQQAMQGINEITFLVWFCKSEFGVRLIPARCYVRQRSACVAFDRPPVQVCRTRWTFNRADWFDWFPPSRQNFLSTPLAFVYWGGQNLILSSPRSRQNELFYWGGQKNILSLVPFRSWQKKYFWATTYF